MKKRKVADSVSIEPSNQVQSKYIETFRYLSSTVAFLKQQGVANITLDLLLKKDCCRNDILDVLELSAIAPALLEFILIDKNDLAVSPYECRTDEKAVLVQFNDCCRDLRKCSARQLGAVMQSREKAFLRALNDPGLSTKAISNKAEKMLSSLNRGIALSKHSGSISVVPTTSQPQTFSSLIEQLQLEDWYQDQIVENGWTVRKERGAVYGELDPPLSPGLEQLLLKAKQIKRVYRHQSLALNALAKESSKCVLLSTSTSSGKSLVYQLAILRELEKSPASCFLLLFPTKALAQDQLRSFTDFAQHLKAPASCYDGDTELPERRHIRAKAQIVFTNVDMLHSAILPNHELWGARFLGHLKLVIVDELHYYNGAFGAHVGMIFRRLQRVCSFYSNAFRFISSTATIGNPVSHSLAVLNSQCLVVDRDCSPRSKMNFVCWNPERSQTSSIDDSVRLALYFLSRDLRVIVFCKFRRVCELVLKQLQDHVPKGTVSGYRGGYDPLERRRIERQLFSGELGAVVATNALELGVDIGSLDVVIHVGFPFSLSSFRQQSGRVGRRAEREALSVFVAENGNPLDALWMRAPQQLLTAPPEECAVDIDNVLVIEPHLQCAAYERGLSHRDVAEFFANAPSKILEQRLVYNERDELFYPNISPADFAEGHTPSSLVSIRSIDEGQYAVVNARTKQVLEKVDLQRAMFMLFEGAIFLNQGASYLVIQLDNEHRCAFVKETRVPWTTVPRDLNVADPVHIKKTRREIMYYGDIDYYRLIFGYHKIDKNNKIVESIAQETPLTSIHKATQGIWIAIPKAGVDSVVDAEIDIHWAMHAANHALLNLVPRYVLSASGCCEMRCECRSPKAQRPRPHRLVIFDSQQHPGMALVLFSFLPDLLAKAKQLLDSCQCEAGCTKCGIVLSNCLESNQALDKNGACIIFNSILDKMSKGVV